MPEPQNIAGNRVALAGGRQNWGRWQNAPDAQDAANLGHGVPGAYGPRTWAPRQQAEMGRHAALIQDHYARQSDPATPSIFSGSDFQNYGYWAGQAKTLPEACDNLVQLLLSFLPESPTRIADVGCGKGAVTARVHHHVPDADLIGIDFSDHQLAQARAKNPDLQFDRMDAGQLAFGESGFDALICVDAAYQIMTRDRFLDEALRLLAPGGTLIFSDLLLPAEAPFQPPENFLEDAQSYAALGLSRGFERVEVFDTTQDSWDVFSEYQLYLAGQKAERGEMRPEQVWLTRSWLEQNTPLACVAGWMRKGGSDQTS